MPPDRLKPLRLLMGSLLIGALGGCTPLSRVVLLPQEGAPNAVDVGAGGQTLGLSRAYEVAEIGRHGTLRATQSDAAAEQKRHGRLLDLQPPAPQRFVLLFEPGTSNLTAASVADLETVVAAARAREGGEIVVIGHTDRQGAADANDALSLRRAQAVRALLIERGFLAERILPVGRGEREPLVPTEDDVPEPRNRRAEVIVR